MRTWLAAALLVALGGCSLSDRDVLFSEDEWVIINSLTPLPDPPADPTNAYADDNKAAIFGQKLFFDPRFSGEIKVGGDSMQPDYSLLNGNPESAGRYQSSALSNGALASHMEIQGFDDTGSFVGGDTTKERIACASCHIPQYGFADRRTKPNDTTLASQWYGIHTQSIYNVAYYDYIYWNGRNDSLWSQPIATMEAEVSHNTGRLYIAAQICDSSITDFSGTGYKTIYEDIFGEIPESPTDICLIAAGAFDGDANTINDAAGSDVEECDASDANRGVREYGKVYENCFIQLDWDTQTEINRIAANIGKAIAAYERKIISRRSPFDKWAAGDDSAMSNNAKMGLKIFIGQGNCVACHNGPNFSDDKFHNIGVPQAGDHINEIERGRFDGIMKLKGNIFATEEVFSTHEVFSDEVTDKVSSLPEPGNRHLSAFRTPSLRSVNLTWPYMHTGAFKTLWDVVDFYNFGGATSGYLGEKSKRISPRGLTDEQVNQLVEFLESLEGEPLDSSLTQPIY